MSMASPVPVPVPGSVVPSVNGLTPSIAPALNSAVLPNRNGNGNGQTSTTSTPLSQSAGSIGTPASASASASPSPNGGSLFFPPPTPAAAALQLQHQQGQALGQHASPAQPAPPTLPNKAGSAPAPNGCSTAQVPLPSPQVPGRPPSAPPAGPQPMSNVLRSPVAQQGAMYNLTAQKEMAEIFKNAQPGVLRQAIRDHWEKCLLNSEYHMAFLLNASFHQASPQTLERAVKDFGGNMIKAAKYEIARQFDRQDLDDIVEFVSSKASDEFLDKLLARRLETIEGRQLINALARAERLGYNAEDIIEQNGQVGREHVIPSLPHARPPALMTPTPHHQTPQSAPMIPSQGRTAAPQHYPGTAAGMAVSSAASSAEHLDRLGVVHCDRCWRPCSGAEALQYHRMKNLCDKPIGNLVVGKDICPHCGSRFGSQTGLTYHVKSSVCGEYSEEVAKLLTTYFASGNWAGPQREAPAVALPAYPPAPPRSTSTPGPKPGWTVATEASPNDPYGHLTPELRAAFEEDMRKGEEHYGHLMRRAMTFEEPRKSTELGRLKNSYNTRQSTTRSKYGVKLRQRRTKEQIDAERLRLFGVSDGPTLSGSDVHMNKRVKTGHPTPTPPSSSMPAETPRKRVPISEMGGLAGSSATAEHTDPTAVASPSFARQAPAMSQIAPSAAHQSNPAGTSDDPMAIDSASESDSSDESESDTDDEDIPAQ